MKIKVESLEVGLLVALALTGCSSLENRCPRRDSNLGTKILEGLEEPGASLEPCVQLVLDDILSERYEYSLGTRKSAFHYIGEKELAGTLPILVEIAKIERSDQEEWKTTLDWVSVIESLTLLRQFGSSETVSLSEARLEPASWIQPVAIRNLRLLSHWESTDKVEHVLCTTPPRAKHDTTLAAVARFLDESPRVSTAVCPCVESSIVALSERSQPTLFSREALEQLESVRARLCQNDGRP